MAKSRQDVVGVNCVKDASGIVLVENDQVKEEWRKYMEKLLNEENTWDNTGRLKRRERKTRHRRKCRGGKRENGKRGTKLQGWKWRERKTRHQSAGVEKARKCIYMCIVLIFS